MMAPMSLIRVSLSTGYTEAYLQPREGVTTMCFFQALTNLLLNTLQEVTMRTKLQKAETYLRKNNRQKQAE